MRELASQVKRLSNEAWIQIVVIVLAAAVTWGSTTSQIGDLRRSQDRTESAQLRLEVKVDGVISEQAAVKASLAASQAKLDAHIENTQHHFEVMDKR